MTEQAVLPVAPERVFVSHVRPGDFRLDGLRPYAEYRDFGFADATHGAMAAHVLRFVPGYNSGIAGKRHIHDVDFQMVFLFKGWISYEFEGVGPITMRPGDAWTQPPAIRHTVTGYSDDCELLELVMPVTYDTIDVPPAGTTRDEVTPVAHLLMRKAAPQRFVVSRCDDATSQAKEYPAGTRTRDFGFGAATGGQADARETCFVRLDEGVTGVSAVALDSIRVGYVTAGEVDVAFDAGEPVVMHPGSCWLESPGTLRRTSGWSDGCRLMEITLRLPE